jgi:hypothetical protein
MVHVPLHFVTLIAAEADIERLISIRRHLQSATGTNYWPDTMHALVIMHENCSQQYRIQ